jgi:hypothetical protein
LSAPPRHPLDSRSIVKIGIPCYANRISEVTQILRHRYQTTRRRPVNQGVAFRKSVDGTAVVFPACIAPLPAPDYYVHGMCPQGAQRTCSDSERLKVRMHLNISPYTPSLQSSSSSKVVYSHKIKPLCRLDGVLAKLNLVKS